MLSGESAIGPYGQKAISVLRMTSSRMELWSRQENQQSALKQCQLGVSLSDCIAEQICNCAVEMGTTSFPHHFINFQLSLNTFICMLITKQFSVPWDQDATSTNERKNYILTTYHSKRHGMSSLSHI